MFCFHGQKETICCFLSFFFSAKEYKYLPFGCSVMEKNLIDKNGHIRPRNPMREITLKIIPNREGADKIRENQSIPCMS